MTVQAQVAEIIASAQRAAQQAASEEQERVAFLRSFEAELAAAFAARYRKASR